MSPAAKSKSKDKKVCKEPPKVAIKPSSANGGAGVPTSGYNPLMGTFHTLDTAPVASNAALHANGRFRNIDEADEPSGHFLGANGEYDAVSNNGSWSGESEDHKDKSCNLLPRQDTLPGADNDKREKIRQKNERKHQRQKERRALELHEKCTGYLMSRKLEALAQQLVAMGFSSERATMALILNEGRVEESVAWLFEANEEDKEHNNVDTGGNLKIDISEELARIADMEMRYKCSKQDVERAVVACEGDLDKAEETLTSQKQEPPSVPPKPEETGDPPSLGNGKLPIATTTNNLTRIPIKPPSSSITPSNRDEKDFNYTKIVGPSVDHGSKTLPLLKRVQPKVEWSKPSPQVSVPVDKRWSNAGSSPVLAASLQASTLPAKTESPHYVTVGNELKNLQLGSVREPVIVMQRPQSINGRHTPSNVSSSPPGTTASLYPNNNIVETVIPNGMMIPGTRSLSSNGISTNNHLYNQLHYQQHQQQPEQFVSSNGTTLESPGTSRGNSLWSRTGASSQTQTIAAASSLGLFSGLGTNGLSGSSSSPVDWSSGGGSMQQQLDYTNIDWSLDRSSSSSRPGGMWPTTINSMHNNARKYDSFVSGLAVKSTTRPVLPNGIGVPIPGLQDGMTTTETSMGGSREWTSPFEEKDLFSLPRQFVSSPSL